MMRLVILTILLLSLLFLGGCHLVDVCNDETLACADLHDQEKKELCLYSYAKEYASIDPCHRIDDGDLQRGCYHEVMVRLDYNVSCGVIEDNVSRDSCHYMSARRNGEAGHCASIRPSSKRDNCYVFIARSTGNRSYCSHAGELVDACFKKVNGSSAQL